MTEHEFYMAADILKFILSKRRGPGGAGSDAADRPLFRPSAARSCLTRRAQIADRLSLKHSTSPHGDLGNFYSAHDGDA